MALSRGGLPAAWRDRTMRRAIPVEERQTPCARVARGVASRTGGETGQDAAVRYAIPGPRDQAWDSRRRPAVSACAAACQRWRWRRIRGTGHAGTGGHARVLHPVAPWAPGKFFMRDATEQPDAQFRACGAPASAGIAPWPQPQGEGQHLQFEGGFPSRRLIDGAMLGCRPGGGHAQGDLHAKLLAWFEDDLALLGAVKLDRCCIPITLGACVIVIHHAHNTAAAAKTGAT
ncbi:hypothetical protein FQR65_LT20530 [Abscondita terminalis]|nr:hypothetical protein FQR65_LT20530 [Abscondita terminalis]